MEKIAILNDIHGNLYLLNKALEYLKDKNISKFLVCGDFLTDGPDDNKIIDTLKSLNAEVILGNREEAILKLTPKSAELTEKFDSFYYTYHSLTKKNLEYLKTLPTTKTITIANKKICMSHGSPYKTREIVAKSSLNLFNKLINDFNADIYLFAHTHRNFELEYRHHLFINSGAISMFMGKPKVTIFGILTINEDITIYEQVILEYDFYEVKKYYTTSNFYLRHPEWCNIILYILKDGIEYNTKFSKMYDYNKSLKTNYYKFTFIYNLPKIVD